MKIFLTELIDNEAYQLIKTNFDIISDFKDIHLCEVVISRNLKIDSHFIEKCLALKLVVVHGSGTDDVDIEYLKSKKIHLCNTPNQNSLSVAELIITMMLQLSRQTTLLNNNYKQGLIKDIAPSEYTGVEISNKTFGVIGLGVIALKTIQILRDGFHMKIIAYSPSLTQALANEYGIGYCETMDDVFKNADYISVNASLNKDTYHMITSSQLSLMKPTAFLINTSRGSIINEEDLYKALKEGWIAGAGLDVLEDEPVNPNHPLLKLDNVIYTPHVGATTNEALKRAGMQVYDIIKKYSIGEMCEHFLI